jgi:DNA transformation protein and related proteins
VVEEGFCPRADSPGKRKSLAMATEKGTVEFILEKLGSPRFAARPMFGEYTLYADDKAVALVCDDLLYVKDHALTQSLDGICEKGVPYPGAKPHFVVDEGQLSTIGDLPKTLLRLAAALPQRKPSAAKRKRA